ncbi:NAD-dependent epimerase/dehydratase family protein [Desulforhopalus singaporensis]|uniref:Nucleoside-diphosphate-sugar epimerase n=1 Tax=Desulforhopalus singaporensis TaxID=91360 RepID=A0A1H0PF09_9BACT|nr:NAD-dependent epimerase/dehydratase family protein [Desulforhopalus singaporensis]SDP03593.1 Nucleoside-diphosphate-sugar epimerase [Desulforhopalus singaporensis]
MGTEEVVDIEGKKALVTGGGGFVGRAIVNRLLAKGVNTRVVGRNRYPALEALGVECIRGSVADPDVVATAAKDVDMVFHTAALAGIWGKWSDYYTTNVVGTSTVIDGCRKNNVPILVHTSSPSVVFNCESIEGDDESLPYGSTHLCHYAKSKIMAEKEVLASAGDNLRCCALRPHLIWGPGDPHLLPRLIAAGTEKKLKRVGSGDNLVDISYIDNVAEAHILAAQNLADSGSASGQAFFISQGEPVNLWDWINDLFSRLDIPKVEQAVSYKTAYSIGWIMEKLYLLMGSDSEPRMTRFLAEQLARSHYFSIGNAQRLLGYTPAVSTEQGLQTTVNWLMKR